jgi:hypothetical protein
VSYWSWYFRNSKTCSASRLWICALSLICGSGDKRRKTRQRKQGGLLYSMHCSIRIICNLNYLHTTTFQKLVASVDSLHHTLFISRCHSSEVWYTWYRPATSFAIYFYSSVEVFVSQCHTQVLIPDFSVSFETFWWNSIYSALHMSVIVPELNAL